MKKSKLIQLLNSLKKEELPQFSDFLASPYFNRDENVTKLWNYIKNYYPDFPEEYIKKEVVFANLYPQETFDGKRLAYLMNYLLKQGESYFQIKALQDDQPRKEYYLLRQFYQRDLNKHFLANYKKVERKLLDVEKENLDTYYYNQYFYQLQDEFQINKTLRKKDNPNLKLAHDHLDQFYFINKIMYCCEMLNRKQIYSTDYGQNIALLNEIEDHLNKSQPLSPLLNTFFKMFLLLKEPSNDNHFHEFNEELQKNEHRISKAELATFYLNSINYSIRKIRNGQDQYLEIALNTFMKGIENRVLFENDVLPYKTFLNTYSFALRLGKYNWVEKFINEYYKFLPVETQKDAFHYSLSDLYFQKKDYDKVLDNVNKVDLKEMAYSLGARAVMIKTYYELDEMDPLLSLLASFTIYLKRNRNISDNFKKAFLNFCQLVNKLLKIKPHKIERLELEMKETQPLIDRKWLVEKLEEQAAILS